MWPEESGEWSDPALQESPGGKVFALLASVLEADSSGTVRGYENGPNLRGTLSNYEGLVEYAAGKVRNTSRKKIIRDLEVGLAIDLAPNFFCRQTSHVDSRVDCH